MAIHSIPLLAAEKPPPMTSGIELFLAEAHNVFPGSDGGADPDELVFKALTVLVSFSVDDADRTALWPIRHALSFAKCSSVVLDGNDWPNRLLERLAAVEPELVTATLFVGEKMVLATETLQAAIDVLRNRFGSALAVLVVVSAEPRRWPALRGVSGFVQGAESTSGGTGRQVFLAMAALMAPQSLNGIDIVDLIPLLGAADRPTVVAEAVWLGGHLIYTSEASHRMIKASSRVLAVPLVRDLDWKGLREIHAALNEELGGRPCLAIWAPVNAVEQGVLFEGVGAVILLGAGDG